MISPCEFNPQECHLKCKNFQICSLIYLEKHISEVECKINNLYEGINHLTEFCSNLGEAFSYFKEDVINEFNLIIKNIKPEFKPDAYYNKETYLNG